MMDQINAVSQPAIASGSGLKKALLSRMMQAHKANSMRTAPKPPQGSSDAIGMTARGPKEF